MTPIDRSGNDPEDAPPSYTLTAYIALAASAIKHGLPRLAWVEAIIFNIKPNRGGFTVELVDAAAKNPVHGATLHAFAGLKVLAEIEAAIGCRFSNLAGKQARLLIESAFHPRYHLEGIIVGIDPAIAAGLLAQRLDELRAQLKAEGLYAQQKEWRAPKDLTRIVVIHPDFSEGWADIKDRLYHFEAKRILRVYSVPASFEGINAAASLRSALIKAEHLVWDADADLILIVRGGGAASGLGALADPELARRVCIMPAPIITGTGHATDHSILDEVAWMAVHTPSLALKLVEDILRRRASDALRSYRFIVARTEDLVERTFRPRLEASWRDCRQSATALLLAAQAQLAALHAELSGTLHALPRELALRQGELMRMGQSIQSDTQQALAKLSGTLGTIRADVLMTTQMVLDGREENLRSVSSDMAESVLAFLDAQRAAIDHLLSLILDEARRLYAQARTALEDLHETIGTLSLDGTLRRGFAAAVNGRVVLRTRAAAGACDTFELLFADGLLCVSPR